MLRQLQQRKLLPRRFHQTKTVMIAARVTSQFLRSQQPRKLQQRRNLATKKAMMIAVKKSNQRKPQESNQMFQQVRRQPPKRRTHQMKKQKKKRKKKKRSQQSTLDHMMPQQVVKMKTRKNFSLETYLSKLLRILSLKLLVSMVPLLMLSYPNKTADLRVSPLLSSLPTKKHKLLLTHIMVRTLREEP